MRYEFYEYVGYRTVRAWGAWWACFQIIEVGHLTFYGVKLWGLALYVRWNTPRA